jgi:hypothetical protein
LKKIFHDEHRTYADWKGSCAKKKSSAARQRRFHEPRSEALGIGHRSSVNEKRSVVN